MERWRVAFAIVASLTALPLLAIDNVSSANPDRDRGEVAADAAVDLLALRAEAWTAARQVRREEEVREVVALAHQVKASEAARLAEEARAAQLLAAKAREASRIKAAADTEAARRRAAQAVTVVAKPFPAHSVSEPTSEQWARLRDCESGGDYGAVSPGGRYRGAYQFDQATWDDTVRSHVPRLLGVDPAAAAPADQDQVAKILYRLRGASPWPGCGRALL